MFVSYVCNSLHFAAPRSPEKHLLLFKGSGHLFPLTPSTLTFIPVSFDLDWSRHLSINKRGRSAAHLFQISVPLLRSTILTKQYVACPTLLFILISWGVWRAHCFASVLTTSDLWLKKKFCFGLKKRSRALCISRPLLSAFFLVLVFIVRFEPVI